MFLLLALTALPDWASSGGTSPKFPARSHLTGYAVASTMDAAKTQAAAQLTQQVSVRVESNSAEVTAEKNGKESYAVSSLVRATSDVRVSGLSFLTHEEAGKAYALANISREQLAKDRRALRDQAFAAAQEQMKISAFNTALLRLAEALEHDSVARAVTPPDGASLKLANDAATMEAEIAKKIEALAKARVSTLPEAAAVLSTQLLQQGLGKAAKIVVAPLTYGNTAFSSVFGSRMSSHLEAKIVAGNDGKIKGDVAIKGSYQVGDDVRVLIIAREVTSGRAIASAECVLAKKDLPPVVPQNLEQALIDQKILGEGEAVSGSMRVEVWTQKGTKSLVYKAKEELRIFIRVNKPAWVRLVYLLASGAKVPVTQAYYIDASKANLAVEYPDLFEITAPYGVERLQAVAFSDKPDPLPTVKKIIDGESYDVVTDTQTLVLHRGLKKKSTGPESAESVLTITTLP